jgi:hypothetical protein
VGGEGKRRRRRKGGGADLKRDEGGEEIKGMKGKKTKG